MKDVPSVNRKLTDSQAAAIRYLVGSGKLSQRKAASEYGVSKRTIAGIMDGRLYRPAKPVQAFDFDLVEVRPLPTTFEQQTGRSYSIAPTREQRSA